MEHATRPIWARAAVALGVSILGGLLVWAALDRDQPARVGGAAVTADLRATALAAGARHLCALTTTRELRCWGANSFGQLGDGDTRLGAHQPATPLLAGGVAAVAAGTDFTCAIDRQGATRCWGVNLAGQLGDGTRGNARIVPVTVGHLRGATALALGANHACALDRRGTVACWGENTLGQSGQPGVEAQLRPAAVQLAGAVVAIGAGDDHTCAADRAGAVWCWGYDGFGQLGDGRRTDRRTPVRVPGLDAVEAVDGGAAHTCARTRAGEVWCWGANERGQLGDGTTTDRAAPVQVRGVVGVTAITVGSRHACAAAAGGRVWCWGANEFGQLGDGSRTDRPTPVTVGGVRATGGLATSGDQTCAIEARGALRCWDHLHPALAAP